MEISGILRRILSVMFRPRAPSPRPLDVFRSTVAVRRCIVDDRYVLQRTYTWNTEMHKLSLINVLSKNTSSNISNARMTWIRLTSRRFNIVCYIGVDLWKFMVFDTQLINKLHMMSGEHKIVDVLKMSSVCSWYSVIRWCRNDCEVHQKWILVCGVTTPRSW